MAPSSPADPAAVASPQSAPPAFWSLSSAKRQKKLSLVAVLLLLVAGGLFAWNWKQMTGAHTGSRMGHQMASVIPFELEGSLVPQEEIRSGGVPKDGIPAITRPQFLAAEQAVYLQPSDRVIGVEVEGSFRAYPLRILNFHEIVNDQFGEKAIAVTYCPLCDSAAVFDRGTDAGSREFGVSGLLFNSNVLMYDRETDSLWSQMMSTGITGKEKQQPLRNLPLELTTWADWQARHPESEVLSTETGFPRNYSRSPYEQYFASPRLMFPAQPEDRRLPAKSPVLGLWTDSTALAVPLGLFAEAKEPLEISVQLGNATVRLLYQPASHSLRVVEADDGVRWMYSFWFAWYAFHPQTELHEAQPRGT